MYVMGSIELIFDKAVDDRTLSYTLVPDKNYLEFDGVLLMGGVTQLFVIFGTHLSNEYIINHQHYIFDISNNMDIYNFAKYQNIADRIKRLSNATNISAQTLDLQSSNKYRRNMVSPYDKKEKCSQQFTVRLNYLQKQPFSRAPTQETQRKIEQQSYSFINDLLYLRQSQSNRLPSRQKRPVAPRINEAKLIQQQESSQERSTVNRYAEYMQQNKQMTSLSKAKSDSSLKIDEILQSYNNYKLNKQNFLSSLDQNNNQSHSRVMSKHLKQLSSDIDKPENIQQEEKQFKKDKVAFGEIDNIWNQEKIKEDKAPIFLRSKKPSPEQFTELCQKLSCQILQKSEEQNKPRSFSRSKLILKNLVPKKQEEDIQSKSTLNMILSPRGLRIPGKICRNNDKSMVALPKYQ